MSDILLRKTLWREFDYSPLNWELFNRNIPNIAQENNHVVFVLFKIDVYRMDLVCAVSFHTESSYKYRRILYHLYCIP